MCVAAYPKIFRYRLSHFEGSHTSYSWQTSVYRDEVLARIISETKCFYIIETSDSIRKVRKDQVEFI
jgi:hypothetical protein